MTQDRDTKRRIRACRYAIYSLVRDHPHQTADDIASLAIATRPDLFDPTGDWAPGHTLHKLVKRGEVIKVPATRRWRPATYVLDPEREAERASARQARYAANQPDEETSCPSQ